jgi:hypothetical protein
MAVTEEERQVWAAAKLALETTDCQPKNVYTAREALERAREALQLINDHFENKDNIIPPCR